MDIEQIQKAKRETEQKISEILRQFSDDTGLTVSHIELFTVQDFGKRNPEIIHVKLDIHL